MTSAEHAATAIRAVLEQVTAFEVGDPRRFNEAAAAIGYLDELAALAERATELERANSEGRAEEAELRAEYLAIKERATELERDKHAAWEVARAQCERAERAETALRLLANGLHTPPDEPGDISDGVTVHAWSPGHPMGCIVCFALDEILSRAALGETAPPPNPFLQPNPAVPEVIWGEENPHEEDRPPPRSFGETAPSATAGMTPDEREKWYGGVGYPDP